MKGLSGECGDSGAKGGRETDVERAMGTQCTRRGMVPGGQGTEARKLMPQEQGIKAGIFFDPPTRQSDPFFHEEFSSAPIGTHLAPRRMILVI